MEWKKVNNTKHTSSNRVESRLGEQKGGKTYWRSFECRTFSTIVRHKEDESIVKFPRLLQRVNDPSNILVKEVDHGGKNLHLACRDGAFLVCKILPLCACLKTDW